MYFSGAGEDPKQEREKESEFWTFTFHVARNTLEIISNFGM